MSEYVSYEPPCGWLKLQSLFIQKSAYLFTHVDWDNEPVNFESLAQIVSYGKRALRECLERKHETDSLKEQRDELLELLELLVCAFESCDETGYVDGHGFIDTEDLTEKARQAIAKAKGEL